MASPPGSPSTPEQSTLAGGSREEVVMRDLFTPTTRKYSNYTLHNLFLHLYSQLGLRHPMQDQDKKIITQLCESICNRLESRFVITEEWQRIISLAMVHRFQLITQQPGWSGEEKTVYEKLILQQDSNGLLSSLIRDSECADWHRTIGELFGLEGDASLKEDKQDSTVNEFTSLEQVLAWVQELEREPAINSAGHELLLPPPPLYFRGDEFAWVDTTNPTFYQPLIDPAIGGHPPCSEHSDLLKKAVQEVLTIPERHLLLEALSTQPRLGSSLHPDSLPELVEKNPIVASELLSRLDKAALETYIQVLISAPTSARSMEVISKLTTKIPKPLLKLYVCMCISSCESTNDKYLQARLVRLVCVFLQSVIRTIELDGELWTEVSSFCLANSRVKEAVGLYRQMKVSEGGVE